jgi:hypothetical protein
MAESVNVSSDGSNWLRMSDSSKQGEAIVYPHLSGAASPLKNLRVLNLAGCIQAGKQLSNLARLIAEGPNFFNVECLNLSDVGAMNALPCMHFRHA